MTTSPKKTWIRATQKTKKFPKNKYGFLAHLRTVGDFVVSQPMPIDDFYRIKNAVYHWAYRHKCRVLTRKVNMPDGQCKIYIRLADKHRVRDYS